MIKAMGDDCVCINDKRLVVYSRRVLDEKMKYTRNQTIFTTGLNFDASYCDPFMLLTTSSSRKQSKVEEDFK